MRLQNKFDPYGDLHDSCKVCTMLSRKWQNLAESCVYDQCVRLFYPKRGFFCLSECVISNQRFTDRNMSEKYRFTFQMTSWSSKETSWFDLYFICLQSKIKFHWFRMYKYVTLFFLSYSPNAEPNFEFFKEPFFLFMQHLFCFYIPFIKPNYFKKQNSSSSFLLT